MHRKLIGVRARDDVTPIDVTRVYASDAADRMAHSTKQVVSALRMVRMKYVFSSHARFISQPSINIIAQSDALQMLSSKRALYL